MTASGILPLSLSDEPRLTNAEALSGARRTTACHCPGELETHELIQPTHNVVLKARYTERGQTVEGTLAVSLVIGVAPTELIRRNLTAAIEIKQGMLPLRELPGDLSPRRRPSVGVWTVA